jgi:hypothetical protein
MVDGATRLGKNPADFRQRARSAFPENLLMQTLIGP